MTMLRAVLAVALLAAAGAPVAPADPLVTVWYRGTPAGTPRADELAGIRALGFGGVTWPAAQTAAVEGLRKMAADVGIQVAIAPAPTPVTPVSLLDPPERVDLIVTPRSLPTLTALAWRAVAHGARVLAFDSGAATGAGLENADRSLKPWARAAIGVARQFSANRRLIEALKPGPGAIVTPESSPALDIALLDAGRSWVLIATNAGPATVKATVLLPAGAPYAIWVNLLDNAPLAMIGEAAGPRWNLKLESGAARVYIIDKAGR
jgi:hypothetical protein